jgi:LAO/AO transport system kinase
MRRQLPSIEQFVAGIRAGDRVLLGQAITLIESTRSDHQQLAQEVINKILLLPPVDSYRIGITGAPGVGKSTLIEALGMHLVEQGKRVAVLAVDPSSAISQGSILGDKTRMEQLSASPKAFIRPSPSGNSLGGVARKTRETILLVEAAGFDTVLVETVGVGQSEFAVHYLTDVFLLLLLPGAGDDLQGIKRGIVEMADFILVNKSDGDRLRLANEASAHYINATHLLPPKASQWPPKVLTCSALEKTGIEALWQGLEAFHRHGLSNGYFIENRKNQASYWLKEALQDGLSNLFYQNPAVVETLKSLEQDVLTGRTSPFHAAEKVLAVFKRSKP